MYKEENKNIKFQNIEVLVDSLVRPSRFQKFPWNFQPNKNPPNTL